jgi:nicotinamidase-related amidase
MAGQLLIRPLPMQKIRIDNTALLIIDMEQDFVNEGAVLQTPGALDIIPTINKLSSWARSHKLPVIFTHEMHRADESDYGIELEFDPVHCVAGTAGCELTEGLDVQPSDHRIRNKRRYDCFVGTDLDLLLRSNRVENLVCCGVTTHCCVMATVYTARSLDYRAIVSRDAVAAISLQHQDAALLCMSEGFAYISTSDEVLALWQ